MNNQIFKTIVQMHINRRNDKPREGKLHMVTISQNGVPSLFKPGNCPIYNYDWYYKRNWNGRYEFNPWQKTGWIIWVHPKWDTEFWA